MTFNRRAVLCVFLVMLAAGTVCAETANFDDARPGELPAGWVAGVTGSGTPNWSVEADATAPSRPHVLRQSGEGTFPWCVKSDAAIQDGFVEVTFKPVAGKEDRAGGLIWRWQDGDNYYVARANALEHNVTIYHTVNGRRVSFHSVNLHVAGNVWHTLRVDFTGRHFTVRFDGAVAMEADDETFTHAGGVGVWTKADSVTLFDDFRYGSTSRDPMQSPMR